MTALQIIASCACLYLLFRILCREVANMVANDLVKRIEENDGEAEPETEPDMVVPAPEPPAATPEEFLLDPVELEDSQRCPRILIRIQSKNGRHFRDVDPIVFYTN